MLSHFNQSFGYHKVNLRTVRHVDTAIIQDPYITLMKKKSIA